MNIICALAAAAAALVSTAWAAEPTVDEIISKHVAARGGLEALRAVKAIKREGRIVVPGFPAELVFVETRARPGAMKQEVTFQGLTQVVAYDGAGAWQINPFQGRKDPERLSAGSAEAKQLSLAADLDTPLVDWRAKGVRIDYLGTEDVDGTPAWKLKATLKSGDEAVYFIDPDSGMIIRAVEKHVVRGAEQVTETDFGEYEKVAGVYFPMTEETGPENSPSTAKQKAIFDKAEAIDPPPASFFAFPAGR